MIAPTNAVGDIGGGGQRTMLTFEALAALCSTDVLVIGPDASETHGSCFNGAARIFAVRHGQPADRAPWRHVRRLAPRYVALAAAAASPRRHLYEPDLVSAPDLAAIDFDAYDVIVGRYLRPSARTGVLTAPSRPVLIDVDDRDDRVLETRLSAHQLRWPERTLTRWRLRQHRQIMDDLLPRAAHLWTASDEDRPGLNNPSISVLPNIPFNADHDTPASAIAAEPATILFAGSAFHLPNRKGLTRFLRGCWPAIRQAAPDARLRVTGNGWDRCAPELSEIDGVEFVGVAPDMGAEYRRAAFIAAPIYDGAGTKIKILEAFAFNRAVIADEHCRFGLHPELQAAIDFAQSDEEMTKNCLAMLGGPDARDAKAKAGAAVIAKRYTRRIFAEIVQRDCANVMSNCAAKRR
ncbi:MAG: glycosyltransferase family 4 protein [Pseudomonadota bacterium]